MTLSRKHLDPSTLLDPLCRLLLARAVFDVGLNPCLSPSAADLASAFRALQKYRPLLATYAGLLADPPLAVSDRASMDRAYQSARTQTLQQEPDLCPHIDLAEACAAALPAVLAGDIPATDVLFPRGGMERVEPIYRDNPWANHFNRLMAEACCRAVEAWHETVSEQPIRIIEIGAGTGGTSGFVLEQLVSRHALFEYLYTDISVGFISHGRKQFGKYGDSMVFKCLDIEKDPLAQGFTGGSAHIVLATNVLHATRNIKNTLKHVSSLLTDGGILLLSELTQADAFAAMTFGLLDGWWLFDDPEYRLAQAPIVSATGWRQALTEVGFVEPAVYGWEGREDAFQCLLVSAKPSAETLNAEAGAAPVSTATSLQTMASPDDALCRQLRRLLAERLGYPEDDIDLERPFGEIGVDSIVAPQFAADVSAALGLDVDVLEIFEHSSVDALAAVLKPRLASSPLPPADSSMIPAAQAATTDGDDIAIIGMACRFPGASDVTAFWDLLVEGRDATGPIPAQRWAEAQNLLASAGLLPDADCFDPDFFRISHAEAEVMDPQQRVFLEACWHALEDAGLGPDRLKGQSCGVFVGVAAQNHPANRGESRAALGNSNAILAARIAYHLDLKGPAVPLDTACSSSLVAIHLAAQALKNGDCDLALAGGVSVLLCTPALPRFLAEAGMVSETGRCRAFDAAADGFVPAEGVGVVVLRRLDEARARGDRILGVIRASGINQDGRTSGITAPSGSAQTALLQQVWKRAGIDPASLSLIEAHGTGTPLGDPIEAQSLSAAFAERAPETGTCALGSVKTNIGHALTAAGVAGVIKVLLALQHQTIPPSLHFQTPNPRLNLENSPFYIPDRARPWLTSQNAPRRAAVSSFGFSGTNAHLVIEQAPGAVEKISQYDGVDRLVLLSAQDPQALQRQAAKLAAWLEQHPETALADICRTLNGGRAFFPTRAAIITPDIATLRRALQTLAQGGSDPVFGQADELTELATLFVSGGSSADWSRLGGAGKVLSLPGYPFARDRFPLPGEADLQTRRIPLDTVLPEHDPVRSEHRWDGQPLFPASALIFLAAREQTGPAMIEQVRWHQTLAAHERSAALNIVPASAQRSRITLDSDNGCHAEVLVRPALDQETPQAVCPTATLGPQVFDHKSAYARFADMGFAYGPVFRLLQSVTSDGKQAIARLDWKPGAAPGQIPGIALIDGIIQAALGLSAPGPGRLATVIPSGLERAWVDPEALQAPLTVQVGELGMAKGERRLKLVAWNANGQVAAHLDGLLVRINEVSSPVLKSTPDAEPTSLIYRPVWRSAPAVLSVAELGERTVLLFDHGEQRALSLGSRTILVQPGDRFQRIGPQRFQLPPAAPEALEALAQALQEQGCEPDIWLNLWPLAGGDTDLLALGPMTLLHGLRAWLPLRDKQRTLTVLQASHSLDFEVLECDPCYAATAGLLLSLGDEEPRFTGKTIALADKPATDELLAPLLTEILGGEGVEVFLDGAGQRFIRAHEYLEAATTISPDVLPRAMVCLISGGHGNLGLTLASQLWQARRARIALLGRRPPTQTIENELGRLRAEGAQILSLTADVTERAAVAAAVATMADRLGPPEAVFHLAGTQKDGFLRGLQPDAVDAVMSPKLVGTRILLDVLSDYPVRLIIGFGSIAGALGSQGQAPYAAANRGMAALLKRCAVNRPACRMLSLDWSYWDSNGLTEGMQAQDRSETAIAASTGLRPLSADQGFELLNCALALDEVDNGQRLLLLYGRRQVFETLLSGRQNTPESSAQTVGDAEATALAYLTAVLSDITRTPAERLKPDRPLEAFGIDSIMVTRVNTRLEADLGRISKTLLFEHRTLRSLAQHLAATHAQVLTGLGHDQAEPPESLPAVRSTPHPANVAIPTEEPIAIIGMAGRFPLAVDVEAYWRNLHAARVCISEVPAERWPLEGFYDPERPGFSYSKWGGFIDEVDRFDPLFFNIAPDEASRMDPQERLFLEVVWQCLEDAGLPRTALGPVGAREVGVYVGIMYGDYQLLANEASTAGEPISGAAPYWSVANRASYALGLEGPSLAIDSACSSSLTALHLACQGIRSGDCRMAVAGGVNLSLHPSKYIGLSQARFASTDGRCHSFGSGGDGYVPGEGVGAVLLKPLSAALSDGDIIHGTIRASAVNHGGRTNGYSVPDPGAQARVIGKALSRAGIKGSDLGYIEAHGTGTRLGDPIEIEGIVQAIGRESKAPRIPIGSAKAAIGHLEAAAGIAGLIKVLLQMRHGWYAPMPLSGPVNPDIDFAATPLQLLTEGSPWPVAANGRRCAGVSSFGAGGANAHLIVEDYPQTAASAEAEAPGVIPLSARTEAQVRALAAGLADYLADRDRPVPPADLCHTLSAAREHLQIRCAFVAQDMATAQVMLFGIGQGKDAAGVCWGEAPADSEALPPSPASRDLLALAEYWSKGGDVLWPHEGRRIALVARPFLGARHWLRNAKPPISNKVPAIDWDVEVQTDAWVFKLVPHSSLLSDHIVGGEPLLPGAAVITLVLEAARLAGLPQNGLRNLVWHRPIQAGAEPLRLSVAFQTETAGRAFSVSHAGSATPLATGLIVTEAETAPTAIPPPPDGAELLSEPVFYAKLKRYGLHYGPRFRRVIRLLSGKTHTYADLNPQTVDYPHGIDPALLDGAFQTLVGLVDETSETGDTVAVPHTLDAVSIMGDPASVRQVQARRVSAAADPVQRFEVILADATGCPVVCLRGLSARRRAIQTASRQEPVTPVTLLRPTWVYRAPQAKPEYGKALVLSAPGSEDVASQLAQRLGDAQATTDTVAVLDTLAAGPMSLFYIDSAQGVAPPPHGSAKAWSRAAELRSLQLLALLRALSTNQHLANLRRLLIVTRGVHALHGLSAQEDWQPTASDAAGLQGLAKVAMRELPNIPVITVDLPVVIDQHTLDLLCKECGDVDGAEIAYRNGRRLARRLRVVQTDDNASVTPKQGDTCFIVGGAGGIGRTLAEHWARHWGARVVLLGRRAADADIEGFLAHLRALGGDGLYLQADATDPAALRAAVEQARQAFGPIQIALHAALVLQDRTLATTTDAEFQAAFAPRAAVGAALIAALADEPPRALLLFSSANLFLGQHGQGNYVAGNAALAALGQAAVASGLPMHLIHWGLWGEVGAVADQHTQARFAAEGVLPISPTMGIDTLQSALANDLWETAAVRVSAERLASIPLVEKNASRRLSPPVQDTSAAVSQALQRLRLPQDIQPARAAFAALERLGRVRAAIILQTMAGVAAKRRMTLAGLRAQSGIAGEHHRLFDALLQSLARDGLIEERDGLWCLQPGRALDADLAEQHALVADLEAAQPWLSGNRQLLENCLNAYPEVLRGQRSAVSVLFPDGATDSVVAAYAGNPISDWANTLLATVLKADVQARLAVAHPVRILEVGAGTGATTAVLLKALTPLRERVRYRVTDLSPHLLNTARQHLVVNGWPRDTAVLDISRDPLAQGEASASYEIVIAANVIHATAAIDKTLEHLKCLLVPGGRLLLNELTATRDMGTLIFGLTPEWWSASDPDTRLPDSPAVAPGVWRDLLAESGFVAPLLSGAEGQVEQSSQSLISALSDGWITPAQTVDPAQAESPPPEQLAQAPRSVADEQDAVIGFLKNIFAEVLGVDPADMRTGDTFERYGLESLSAMEIRNRIAKTYPQVSNTLLFEYQTIARLTDHLLSEHQPVVELAADSGGVELDPEITVVPEASTAGIPEKDDSPIAVIGFAARFPGGESLEAFWSLLRDAGSAIGPVPSERWNHDLFLDTADSGTPAPGHSHTRWGGFIENIERFDPLFFGITPREADSMDPQERLFIETCWAAMEDAGTTPARLVATARGAAGSVGVFCGVMNTAYQWLAAEAWRAGNDDAASTQFWSIPNRVSYLFDFDGPSIAVDTACSSSLTALHLACEAIRRGDCGAALAGGVNLIAHPRQMVNLSQAGMVSAGAECRVFGADADGFVEGEGVGVVLLKPLQQALEDGDRIDGVILGTAINAGGKTSGFTVPNPQAQSAVISTALSRSGLTPADLCLIETHGTGTHLGDPIEVSGLAAALPGVATGRLPLGTLKANIGHLESAAGIASLIKVLLQLRHGMIAPARHAASPNPLIPWNKVPFRLPTAAEPWQQPPSRPRRAAISGFGAGGANAHVIIEEAPTVSRQAQPIVPEILPISARNKPQLSQLAASLVETLDTRLSASESINETTLLADLGRTLRLGRVEQDCRAIIQGHTLKELVESLRALAEDVSHPGLWRPGVQETAESVEQSDATRLARLWLAGQRVNWDRLKTDSQARPLSLPTYPFAGDRYWLDIDPAPPGGERQDRESLPPDDLATRLLLRRWSEAPALPAQQRLSRQSILLIGGSTGLAAMLADQGYRLERLPLAIDSEVLSQRLAGEPSAAVIIVDTRIRDAAAVVATALAVARALAQTEESIRLLHVTPPGDNAKPLPAALAVEALWRSLIAEAPKVSAGSLTLPLSDGLEAARLILAETAALESATVRHVLRDDGKRLHADIAPLASAPTGQSRSFRRQGTYLLIGGLGEVGRHLATRLIQRYQARIAIIGRTPLDDERRHRLAELGPPEQVRYWACDICDQAALETVLQALNETYGSIHGAIHLGRVVSPAPLRTMTAESAAATLAVKVDGSLALIAALAKQRPDWIVLFSSLAAWAGQAGGADYAAACAFQDGLAMTDTPVPLISIAWPQWAHDRYLDDAKRDLWSSLGLATIDEVYGLDALEHIIRCGSGAYSLLRGSSEAVDSVSEQLARFAMQDASQPDTTHPWAEQLEDLDASALAAYRDYLSAALSRSTPTVDTEPQPLLKIQGDEPNPAPVDSAPRPLHKASGSESVNTESNDKLSDTILKTCVEYLKTTPEVLSATSFPDLGLDSIHALRLAERLQRRLQRPVEPVMLLQNPTVERLSEALAAADQHVVPRSSGSGGEA